MLKRYQEFWREVNHRDRARFLRRNRHEGDNPDGKLWREQDYRAAYKWAKQAYLNDIGYEAIAAKTGFEMWELRKFINGIGHQPGWYDEVVVYKEMVMDEAIKKATVTFKTMLEKAMLKLDQAIDNFDPLAEAKTAKQINAFEATVQGLNEIDRLEENKPTSINGNMQLTRHNLKEKWERLKSLGVPVGMELDGLLSEAPTDIDPSKMN